MEKLKPLLKEEMEKISAALNSIGYGLRSATMDYVAVVMRDVLPQLTLEIYPLGLFKEKQDDVPAADEHQAVS